MPSGIYQRRINPVINLKGGWAGKKRPPFSQEWKDKIGLAQKGIKKKPFSELHKKHISESQKVKSSFIGKIGILHPRWKGGKRSELTKIRNTPEYRSWRKAVLNRDNHVCVLCGSSEKLHADHLKSFNLFPEIRFDISNGRTLCKKCHIKTENYGGRSKKFIEERVPKK